jgi:hypothetical protein
MRWRIAGFARCPPHFAAFDGWNDRWKPSAWIIECRRQPVIGSLPTVRNVVRLQHGELVRNGSEQRPWWW